MKLASAQVFEFQEATLCSPRKGEVAEFYSAGGGGYGDPYERPIEAVLEDVSAGLLSVEKACQDYGVVISPQSLTVDLEATQRLRRGRYSAEPTTVDT